MFYKKYVKRIIDILLAGSILILIWWIFLLIAILILLTDGRPVIFAQDRVGRYGKIFKIYKFRTMIKNADKVGPSFTSASDTRITPIGKILRKTSLDELPQVFNVLKGDMSLVGYRPGVKADYTEEDYSSTLFSVKPGITGYAQVNGRSNLTMKQKREWEQKYAADISFFTDIKILFKTVEVVLFRKGSN